MNFDLIVIGSGPGGYVAAIRAAQLGLKTAVIEKESLGGVCLNWGCIPTKALLKSAQVFEYVKNAKIYGINVENSHVNFQDIIQRSRDIAQGMSKGIEFLLKKNKIEKIYGFGKLVSSDTVEVTDSNEERISYTAKYIILATGGRSKELPGLPIDNERIVGYKKALTLEKQPKKIIIVGSGAIGVEFAYFYHAIGTEVIIVEYMPNLLPLEDEEISKQLKFSFEKRGIKVRLNSKVISVDSSERKCKVQIETKQGTEIMCCDIVISAIGIDANIEGIGLEEMGVKTEYGKIVVDTYYRTNIPNIYAIGDIILGPALAHIASSEGIICVEKITGLNPESLDYQNIPACTYCHPEIASVGYTESQAKAKGYNIKVGKFPFSASGKASASDEKEGFIKVIFDAKYGEWLGAHFIGNNVTEMIAEVVVARKLETTWHEIIKSVHPHPTMSEGIMESVADAYGEAIHL